MAATLAWLAFARSLGGNFNSDCIHAAAAEYMGPAHQALIQDNRHIQSHRRRTHSVDLKPESCFHIRGGYGPYQRGMVGKSKALPAIVCITFGA
nr:hypothetical protein [uncultured Desulfobacter sp.]